MTMIGSSTGVNDTHRHNGHINHRMTSNKYLAINMYTKMHNVYEYAPHRLIHEWCTPKNHAFHGRSTFCTDCRVASLIACDNNRRLVTNQMGEVKCCMLRDLRRYKPSTNSYLRSKRPRMVCMNRSGR